MKYEYLLFNLIVFIFPFLRSFENRVHYVRQWKYAFPAIVIVLVPFVAWDAAVAHRHWWFNPAFTVDVHLFGLPIGEWLFFITVPFACLFIWEILVTLVRPRQHLKLNFFRFGLVLLAPLGVWLFFSGKEYTGLVMISLTTGVIVDILFQTGIFLDRRFYIFLVILIGVIFIFNGYLTARPVVLYDPIFQLDFRVMTIPIEDFFYGISHLFLVIIVYEALKRRAAQIRILENSYESNSC